MVLKMTTLTIMKEVLSLEAKAIELAASRLSDESTQGLGDLLKELHERQGSLIFCGVGKSGHIGKKLAATFMSLGLSSYFLHPTEALHGDLGRVQDQDVMVFLSKSGTTEEIIKLMPFLNVKKEHRIALIGNMNSPLAHECHFVLDCSVEKEACVNNQAPTTSSTLSLAMGDALAVLFEKEIGLSKEGFALNHPGGFLGKSIRLKVKHLMTQKVDCPVLTKDRSLKDGLVAMTNKPVGGLAIVDDEGNFEGLIVDGDVRRFLAQDNIDFNCSLESMMNTSPRWVSQQDLAMKAMEVMEDGQRSVSILPVLEDNKFLGFLRLHDLVKEGLK